MFKRLGLLILALSAMAGAAQAQVGADLNISPKRVVFGPGERSATVYIFNQGDEAATYTVELVDRVMLPDGQILPAADRPDVPVVSALELVQHTPRRITLQPRESQAIRVRARPGADPAAEYRSHLTVTALPPETTGFTAEQAAQAASGEVALQVVALFSVSIPVIVRETAPDARASIANVSIERAEGADLVALDLERLGTSSVYGDLEVRLGDDPNAPLLTAVRGVAVYPEVPRRRVMAALPAPLQPGQVLSLTYRDDDARPGEVLATARLVAP
jgi:P pilus assembly chaperone PapD